MAIGDQFGMVAALRLRGDTPRRPVLGRPRRFDGMSSVKVPDSSGR
jgi:hypothetical protein